MSSGLQQLQDALDTGPLPDGWPSDVCRDAFCGSWERNNGQYFWHRPSDHKANDTADPFGIGASTWPGVAKLMEEAGEVVQVCAKLIATGGRTDHWSGDDLRERLSEEMGDLWAALEYVHAHNLIPGVKARREAKFSLFQQWHGTAGGDGG